MLLTDEEIEALNVRTWDARIIERAVLEKLCAGVEMPEAVANVSASSNGCIGFVKPDKNYYTADQLRAYGAAQRLKALEDAAMLATPVLPRPCDCGVCDCGNSGDYARVVDWDSSSSLAKAIRALKGEA